MTEQHDSQPGQLLDCLVLGAGPAGLSAGLWLKKLGLSFIILEKQDRILAEVRRINLPVRDLLGLTAPHGRELAERFQEHVRQAGLPIITGHAAQVRNATSPFEVSAGSETFQAKTLILATGLRRRRLGLAGEAELLGTSISLSATTDLPRLAGLPVGVVGGGDGAAENALLLAPHCPEVTLIHRGRKLRARSEFVKQLTDSKTRTASGKPIGIFAETTVSGLVRHKERLAGVTLDQAGRQSVLALNALVVKIGFEPNREGFERLSLETEENGILCVSRRLETGVPGVFACGDIANPQAPSLAASLGDGAMAAKGVERFLRRRND